jgi:hypothetical protein
MVLIFTALRRIGRGAYSKLFQGAFFIYLMLWDLSLCIINLFTFKRKVGHVTPHGHPGEGGAWPEYIPPKEGDSRCSCPALNAMANHGPYPLPSFSALSPPLPPSPPQPPLTAHARSLSPRFVRSLDAGLISRDGRDISFRDVSAQIRSTYNFSPSFCLYVPRHIARILDRSYTTGRFDLADIDVHNGIEHDASLVRKYQAPFFHAMACMPSIYPPLPCWRSCNLS